MQTMHPMQRGCEIGEDRKHGPARQPSKMGKPLAMASGVPIRPDQIREAAALRRRGWHLERIAEHLGLTPARLSGRLAALDRRAMKRLEADVAALKARQYEQLEQVVAEAFEAWEASKQPATVVETTEEQIGTYEAGKAKAKGKPVLIRTRKTAKGQTGDPRYLGEVRAALAEQRKIMGLESSTVAVAVAGAQAGAAVAPAVADAMLRAAAMATGGDHGPDA
jgi:hypothetical protein